MRVLRWLAASAALLSIACGGDNGGPFAPEPQEAVAIAAVSSSHTIADVGSEVDTALQVRVLDRHNFGVKGAVVHFRVSSGGGSLRDTIAVSSYEGVATARGWKVGPNVGPNTVTASVGTYSVVFTALGVDPEALPIARYGLSLVSGNPLPYTSPWYDLDAIVLNQGTMEIFDGYFVRSLKWQWLFGNADNTQRIRGFATISPNSIDLSGLNIRLEVRGDSLFSTNELLPDDYRTSLTYVRAAQAGASALEGR